MQLTLKYNEHATQSLGGAFIRGNTPEEWLREMNAWQMPLASLTCFIVSQNNNPYEAAGLFVIFKNEHRPGLLQVRHPYTVVGRKLYIPIDAALWPAVTEQELQSLLIWDYQLFHPVIGFIGFEKADSIHLARLLQTTQAEMVDWQRAHGGQLPWVPLQQIRLQQLSMEALFDGVSQQINNKLLEDIPTTNKREVPGWLNNPVAKGLLKGMLYLIGGVAALIPGKLFNISGGGSSGGNNRSLGNSGRSGKPGILQQIKNWIEETIEDLEKQRESELKRLMDLFEKNTDEALQYAIPLGSPYMDRGTAAPSSRLTKRDTRFSMGNLGGGYATDGWNIGNYYDDLRSRYIKAANKAISEKDYKKAAYIYAHLLGDYTAAAKVLRDGKHYREAALLYKDHLKNRPVAAECLEEGGLFTEAIELYTELHQHEKAGDIYRKINQEERALQCYEKCVVTAAANRDYLEESRLIIEKIGDPLRAKKVLLNGWNDVKQPEACLSKYFDLVAAEENSLLHERVRTFYEKNQLAGKRINFLNVITGVNNKYKTGELETTCRNIAYEVVSEEVNAGNTASLHRLQSFIQGDQLLSPDCTRYINTEKNAAKRKPAVIELQLMKEVQWKKVTTWKNQLLVWGTKWNTLVLARINNEGHIEYYSWNESITPNTSLIVLTDPESTAIIVYVDGASITQKLLPGNKHFQEELIVYQPNYLPAGIRAIGLRYKEIITLHEGPEEVFMNVYSLKGDLQESKRCKFNHHSHESLIRAVQEMTFCDESLFMVCDKRMWRISGSGVIDFIYYNDEAIRQAAINKRSDGLVDIAFAHDERVYFEHYHTADESDTFADINNISTVDIKPLPNNRFAIAEQRKVYVYDITYYNSPKTDWQKEMAGEVAAVFQGTIRDQLGVLETTGRLTLHNIEKVD